MSLFFDTPRLGQQFNTLANLPWDPFEKAASAAGVSVTEYEVLLKALETEQPQQYSVAKGETIDFSAAMAQVEAS